MSNTEGFEFYAEADGRNVVAVFGEPFGERGRLREALGAVFFEADSPVASTAVSAEFLATCRRVEEDEARQIHPRLFERLDV